MIAKLNPTERQAYRDGMVRICPDQFKTNVDLRPFRLKHELAKHPLFQLESLVELAKRLPARIRRMFR